MLPAYDKKVVISCQGFFREIGQTLAQRCGYEGDAYPVYVSGAIATINCPKCGGTNVKIKVLSTTR